MHIVVGSPGLADIWGRGLLGSPTLPIAILEMQLIYRLSNFVLCQLILRWNLTYMLASLGLFMENSALVVWFIETIIFSFQ